MTVKGLAALVVAVAAVFVGTPGAVAAPTATSTPVNAISISIAPDDFTDLRAGQTLRLTATITNAAATDFAGGDLTLTTGRTALATRGQLASWTGGSATGVSATVRAARVDAPPVAAGQTTTVALSVAASTLRYVDRGVYPLRARLTSGTTELASANTSVAWKIGFTGGSKVAIVVPLIEPAGNSGLIDADTLTADTAPDGLLTRELDAVANTSATIGIDPRILASIRILGNTAPQSALDWLDRLAGLSNDTFPLAWADADETAELQAGARRLLQPKSLEYAIDPKRFRPVQDANSTATPTPDPTQQDLPTSADLVAWDYTLPALRWPAENTVSAKNLAVFASGTAPRVLLSSQNVTRTAASSMISAGTLGKTAIAVSDTPVSMLFRAAVAATTDAEWDAAVQQLTAAVAIGGLQASPSPTLTVTLGRDWVTGTRLGDTLSAVSSAPWIQESSLTTILESAGGAAKLVERKQDDQRIDLVTQMLNAERREVRFSTIAEHPATLNGARRITLLALLSNAWSNDTPGWTVAGENFLTESTDIRGSVQVTRSSTINFLSDSGALPVTVRNDLGQAVTVYVRVRPQTALLTVEQPNVKVEIEANSQRKVYIPVQRLSNGRVEVAVSLYSGPNAFSMPVGTPAFVEVTVNAGWETAGTLVFGALVVLVFAIGLFRSIRKRRKAARE